MLRLCLGLLVSLQLLSGVSVAYAQSSSPASEGMATSPKPGWGDFTIVDEPPPKPTWKRILLWIPNRVLDFIDIFKIDLGVGSSVGAVVRITPYGQVGYRAVAPVSFRAGVFGRQAPFMAERSSEFGIGPFYAESHDRTVCPGELGVGADLLVGAYGGICLDEVADFFGGLFFLGDLKGDDH